MPGNPVRQFDGLDKKMPNNSLKAMLTTGWWQVFSFKYPRVFVRYGHPFFVSRIPKVLALFCIGCVIVDLVFKPKLAAQCYIQKWQTLRKY